MTRLARVVAVGLPHHITQRGNARQYILHSDADRTVYLDLLRQNIEQHNLALMGYCLMSNHVHLITVPPKANVLGLALKDTHGRYASYWNAIHHSSGHVCRAGTIPVRWTRRTCGRPCAIQSSIRYGRVWWKRLSLGRGPAPQPIAPRFQPVGTWPWSNGKLAGRLVAGADISPQEKANPN